MTDEQDPERRDPGRPEPGRPELGRHEADRRTPPDRGLPTAGRRPDPAGESAGADDGTGVDPADEAGEPAVADPDDEPTVVASPPVKRPLGLADDKTTRLPPPPAWPSRPPAADDEPTLERKRPVLPTVAGPDSVTEFGAGGWTATSRADSLADIEDDDADRDTPEMPSESTPASGSRGPGPESAGPAASGSPASSEAVAAEEASSQAAAPGETSFQAAVPGETSSRAVGSAETPFQAAARGEASSRAVASGETSFQAAARGEAFSQAAGPADEGSATSARGAGSAVGPGGARDDRSGGFAGAADDEPTVRAPLPALRDDATMRLQLPPALAGPARRGETPAAEDVSGTPEGGADGGDGPSSGDDPSGDRDRGVTPSAGSPDAVISDEAAATLPAGESSSVRKNDLDLEETAGGGRKADSRTAVARRKLSSAGALIWVLLALFGFTLVVQLRSNSADDGLATARQEDLVRILSDLEARDQRLQSEINALETSRQQLTSGVEGRQAALAEAEKRADELGLLAGTLPGRGTGLSIVIDPHVDKVKASALLNAVQELRGAGGEVMEIAGTDGAAVRIVASTYFVDADNGGIVVDGTRLAGPWTISVIGQPQTMQTALQIPGGVVASVNSAGGSVTMEPRSMVEVTAVRKATSLQYARPVS